MGEAPTSMNLRLFCHLLGTSPACQDWVGLSENRGVGVGKGQDLYSSRNKSLIGETKLAIGVGRAMTLVAIGDAQDENNIQGEH